MKYCLIILSLITAPLYSEVQILNLGKLGYVRYITKKEKLHKIQRMSPENEILYTHEYIYGESDSLLGERLLDANKNEVYSRRFEEEKVQKNPIFKKQKIYTKYDLRGNLIRVGEKKLTYNKKSQLVKVVTPQNTVKYGYDALGKRISKTVNGTSQYFAYLGINEFAVLDSDGNIIELRIPGISFHKDMFRAIAIETPEAFFASVLNDQGSCIKLINISTKEEISLSHIDLYGGGLSPDIPISWVFSGKYYDREVDLVYFGNRYYSPEIRAWITPDPLNQSEDPYLFCMGNPSKFTDPDGLWAIALPLVQIAIGTGATLTAPIWLPISATTAACAVIGYLGQKGYKYWEKKKSFQEEQRKIFIYKSGSVDSSLPVDPDDLLKRPGWEEVSHTKEKKHGHRTFENKKTGEKLRHDRGDPSKRGHSKHDHYHRFNPKTQGRHDRYLDHNRNPVGKNSEESHLYPPETVWWD